MINKVILIGNVGQDPEVRYTGDASNGAKVATLRLATTERYKDRNGNLQEHTEWHSVVVWRNTADVVEKYVRKGMKLYIEGKLQTRTWEKDGQVRRKTEIIAENIQVLYRPTEYRNETVAEGNTPTESEVAATPSIPTLEIEDIF